jgi:hypothetical protein
MEYKIPDTNRCPPPTYWQYVNWQGSNPAIVEQAPHQYMIGSRGTDKFLLSLFEYFPTTIVWTKTSFFCHFILVSLALLYWHRQVSSVAFDMFPCHHSTDTDKFLLPLLTHFSTTIQRTKTSIFCHFIHVLSHYSTDSDRFCLPRSRCFPATILWTKTTIFYHFWHISLTPFFRHIQVSSTTFNTFPYHHSSTDTDKFLLPLLTRFPTTIPRPQTSCFCPFCHISLPPFCGHRQVTSATFDTFPHHHSMDTETSFFSFDRFPHHHSTVTDKSLLPLSARFPATILGTKTTFFCHFLHISQQPLYGQRRVSSATFYIFPKTIILWTQTSFFCHFRYVSLPPFYRHKQVAVRTDR